MVPAGPATEASVSLRKAFLNQARFFASLLNYSSWKSDYSPHQELSQSYTQWTLTTALEGPDCLSTTAEDPTPELRKVGK